MEVLRWGPGVLGDSSSRHYRTHFLHSYPQNHQSLSEVKVERNRWGAEVAIDFENSVPVAAKWVQMAVVPMVVE